MNHSKTRASVILTRVRKMLDNVRALVIWVYQSVSVPLSPFLSMPGRWSRDLGYFMRVRRRRVFMRKVWESLKNFRIEGMKLEIRRLLSHPRSLPPHFFFDKKSQRQTVFLWRKKKLRSRVFFIVFGCFSSNALWSSRDFYDRRSGSGSICLYES